MCPLADKSRLLLANTQLDTTMAPLAYAGTAKMARLAISPAVLATLVPTVVSTSDASGYPLADTRDGSRFTDGGDPNLRWYLPAWALRTAPDAAFAFGAVRDGADQNGHPFNRASLTVGLQKRVPDDVAAAQAAPVDPSAPALTYQEIPLTSIAASLLLVGKDDSGADFTHEVAGQVVLSEADPTQATFTTPGLVGPDVILAFVELTATGQASLRLGYSFQVARWVSDQPTPPTGPGPRRARLLQDLMLRRVDLRPPHIDDPDPVDAAVAASPTFEMLATPRLATLAMPLRMEALAMPVVRLKPGRGMIDLSTVVDLPPPAVEAPRTAVHESLNETVTLGLGNTYAVPSYRPLYTLTSDGTTRSIVGADDLEQFRSKQSEYVELTALGNIGATYPTLRAVYLGEVSGTVVAVPAAYGVLRTPDGLLATCQAIVDPAPTSASGCRFQFNFGLGPVIDPGDLARLAADLQVLPSLAGRSLRLTLPTALDSTVPSVIQTSSATNPLFVGGLVPNTFALAWDVVDGDLPAVAAANLLLKQFADPHAQTLVGRIAVKLDDAHQPPVQADLILDVGVTSGSEDVAIVLTPGGDAELSNQTDLPLVVRRQTIHTTAGFITTESGAKVAAKGRCVLDLPDGVDQVLVGCTLDLPDDGTLLRAEDYVEVTVENVARIHHPMGLNAAGQFGDDVAMVSIQMALDRAPEVPVPTVALSPDHPIDNTAVEVPVQLALEGLSTTLALTITPTGGGRPYDRALTHDFLAHPILTLTHEDLTPPA